MYRANGSGDIEVVRPCRQRTDHVIPDNGLSEKKPMVRKMTSRVGGLFALMALFLAAFLVTGAATASAATQTTGFSVFPFYCSQGVYDVVSVQVTGTASGPSINAWWTGSGSTTARVTVYGIPAGGGVGTVVVGYRCNIKVGWWTLPSPPHPASANRWFYGSGYQPGITV